jgi:hypothetical protein
MGVVMFGDNNNQGDQTQQAGVSAVTPAYPASDTSVNTGDSTSPPPATALPVMPSVPAYDPTPQANDDLGALVADTAGDGENHEPELSDTPVPASDQEELMSIKQQALQQLSPLVGQLEQTPEERFKTTMMLIQASDNKDLIADAYKAAGEIEDEKIRAQALLDIINEINYFTQQPET